MATLPQDFIGGRPPVIRSVIVKITDDSSHATVRPSWRAYMLFGFLAMVLGGLFGFLFVVLLGVEGVTNWTPPSVKEADLWVRVLIWISTVAPLLILIHMIFYKFPRKVQFDRTSSIIIVRHSLRFPKQYRLQSLVGLQVCAKFFYGHGGLTPAGPGYEARELNAIFSEGHEPRRVRIMAHGDYKHFIKDATALAKFLGVPLIRSDQS